jgi:branched-chain amino acid transport system ATP-binding protein
MRLCDRIHVLAEGRTIGEGSPVEVRANQAVIDAYLGVAGGDGPPTAPRSTEGEEP